MRLSTNLMLSEVIRSESAKRGGISNAPSQPHLKNLVTIATNVFQPIRDHFGVPIHISSGYRSPELNRLVGGSTSSQHSSGEALDIDMDGTAHPVTNKMVFDFILNNLEFDQLIWEFGSAQNPDWVHVSYKANGPQRKQVLRAVKKGGRTIYEPYTKSAS
jgi:zinc D-Ala-D-Ala carboxypeptidase